MSNFKKRLAKELENPEFAKAWEETKLEYLLARNMIKERKRRGISQDELAKLMNTKQSVISRIEAGDANVTLKTLKDIAKALDIDAERLIADESSSNELAVAVV